MGRKKDKMEYYCKKCGEVCIKRCGMVICRKCGYEVTKDKADRDALLEACKAAQIMLLQSNWNGDDRINIVSAAIAQAEREG